MISRAQALQPAVQAASNETEDGRRIAPGLLDRLHEAKLFRLLLPKSANGVETDPVTFFHVIETIASGDASTAWCLSQAGGCAMTAAYLAPPVAHEIFGSNPRAVLAWGPGPRVKAIECIEGGKVAGVETNEGRYHSGCVILATGPWAARLAEGRPGLESLPAAARELFRLSLST